MNDYVLYGDTDSCYIGVEKFILDNISNKDKWICLSDEKRLNILEKFQKK